MAYRPVIEWVNSLFSGKKKMTSASKAGRSKELARAEEAAGKIHDLIALPKGFAMSIAAKPQMAAGGFKIPGGVAITGMIRMKYLGYGYLKLQVDIDNEIFICQCEMSPIKFGPLNIYRNLRDKHLGPKLFLELNGVTSTVAINME